MSGEQRNNKIFNRDMRRFIFTCNAYIIILIVIAAAIILNLLAARLNFRLDLTANKLYSLSDVTIQTLKELDKQKEDLHIYGFYQKGQREQRMLEGLLKEYIRKSKKIKYEFLDPYKNRKEATEYQIQEPGTLVVTLGNQKLHILPRDIFEKMYNRPDAFYGEQALTRTINRLLNTKAKNLYFLQGHAEKDIYNAYSRAQSYFTNEGYAVKPLNLMKEGTIPDDCNLLVIAGPQQDLLSPEIKTIEEYMSKGGRLMVFVDYLPQKALPNLKNFLNSWGIDYEDSMVIEMERRSLFDPVTIFPNYLYHAITQKLMESNLNAVLPGNRALKKIESYKGDAQVNPILESSPNSWAEKNPRGKVKQDANETKGPITLGLAATRGSAADANKPESRLVVLGNSSFIDNNFVDQGANLNLFYNIAQWLMGQEERITIAPKQTVYTYININKAQASLIRWFTLLFLPFAILVTGAIIWSGRRRR